MRTTLNITAFFIFTLLCFGVTYYAFTYLLEPIHPNNDFKLKLAYSGWIVPFHFYAGGLALALTPFQLSKKLRNKSKSLHRTLGLLYVLSVLLGGISGLLMALGASGGWVAKSGFFCLAVLWLYTTAMAFLFAVKGDIVKHQQWIYRSVALTAAGITLRLYLGIGLGVMHLPFFTVYVPTAWLCWTLNLIDCEFIIYRQRRRLIAPQNSPALT